MALVLKNNATTTLSSAITTADTIITASDANVFPVTVSPNWFWLTIINKNDSTLYEIVKVTNISGNDITIERAAENTLARDFEEGDIIEQRITRQTLLDLSPNIETSNTKREYLDEMMLSINGMAIFDEGKFIAVNKKYAPRLIEQWNSFYGPKLKSVILDLTNGSILEDSIVFTSTSDIADWISANVPVSGSTAQANYILKPYETVNNDVPPMTKIVGFNRFYSALKGKHNYKKAISTSTYSGLSSNIMQSMFNYVHGTVYADDNKFKDCTWIANNNNNVYTTLHKAAVINHTGNNGGGSRWYNDNGAFSQLSSGEENFNRETTGPAMATLGYAGSSVNLSSVEPFGVVDKNSAVLVYPIKGMSNSSRKAIMIKPIGMDSFQIEIPDFSNYTLEVVAYNDTIQGGVKIKEFTSTGDFSGNSLFDQNSGKMLIDKSNFIEIVRSVNQEHTNNNYSYTIHFNTIRFRLRDKITNEVSTLSKFGIVYENLHKYNTFRFMVKNFDT